MQAKAVALNEASEGAKITPGETGEIDSLLLEWRAKALYVSLLVIVGAGLPAYASVLINAMQTAQMTPLIWGYLAVYLAFVGLAISPRLDFRIRAWGFLLLGYTNAVASFARLGLAGSGRLYLIAMPVIATMLLGSWAGYITGFLSLVIYSVFALLAHWGLLGNWLTLQANPLTLSFWTEAGAALAVFLALMVVLLERFHSLQVRTLAARRQAVAELEQTTAVLREREERLALVMQGTNDGIWDWNLETNEVYFSPRWKAMLGYEEEEIPHRFETWRGLVHPDDIERAMAEIQAHRDGLTPLYTLEHRLLHRDGTYRWILARGIALRDSNAKPYRIAGSHSDITEHKRAQAIQAGQHRFLELLATGGDFSKTLHTLVRIIEEQWPGMLGLILLLDEDGKHLHIGAAVSLPEEYTQSIEGLEIGPLAGSCGAACYRRERVIVEDITTDPRWDGLRDLALKYGLRACWSEPVFSSTGQVVGTFAMYYRQPRAPTKAELDTIEIAAHLVGIAIESQRAEEALQSAYETLERRVEERTQELATLNAIAGVVSRSLDLNEIMNNALDKALEVMSMDLGVAYRLKGSGDPLESPFLDVIAYRGISTELAHQVDPLPLRGSMIEKAAAVEQPVVWQVADYPNATLKQAMAKEGVRIGISVPLLVKRRLVGALILAARHVRPFVSEELSLLAAIGQQVGIAVENARLYEAERERHEEAERRRQVAEGMREILAVLNSRQSLNETLDFIVTQACRVLGSDAASLLRLEGRDGPLKIQSACGLDADYVSSLSLPRGRGGAGRALAERQPTTLPDAAAFATLLAREPNTTLDVERVGLERLIGRGYLALLSVPLIVKNEDYGAITLYYREPRDFSEEEIRLAMSVADQAALAVESDRLREQAEQSAAIAERSRLARELHDSVTQALYSVTLFAEAAAVLLTDGKHLEAAEHLRELRDTAQEALREMRLLIYELRPLALEKTGLLAALQARLEAVEGRGGIQADLEVEGAQLAERLPFTIQEELYHIAREALNNVLKHAQAGCVRVHLQFQDSATCLEICDDGAGFEPERAQERGGLGLRGMEERALKIGGDLHIQSTPGKGTRINLTVPRSSSEFPETTDMERYTR
jgi:PAS domain S-box-containing protein